METRNRRTARTGGPAAGRGPGDGGRSGPGRKRAQRQAALRARAEALFSPELTWATGPLTVPAQGWRVVPRARADDVPPDGPPPDDPPPRDVAPGERLAAWRRARLAVGERWPLWLRGRCGLEPRALAALGVLLLVAAGFAVHHFWTGRPQSVTVATAEPPAAPDESSAAVAVPSPSAAPLVVDVAGDVAEPGIYSLPAGSRVADAIEAAGGSAPGADTEGLNRARPLVDGEQILVGAPQAAPAAGPSPAAGGKVSINSATPEQLQELPGIGPVLAERLIAYRESNGGFTTIEQLGEVSGIGDRRLADLRDRVTL
ncbi:ComEA family DNA-binding protein [Streptomyces millisiae]|uniref:ComEA family DNA-binding protein n=1 Tax=Streptomyces millisiae TaxID=3075542 RepID=A0ABU2M0L5_9ACTN|nr:ComEA family DNA-binding protein [Streptomyces sp. DSM 44918]MDT0323387.1 ComEA family DNA-binding protein [Streptomyces sp. DSM 44918]